MNTNLAQLIEDSVNLSRDSTRENRILTELRTLNASEVLDLLKEMVRRRSPAAISLAIRTLNERQASLELFSFTLQLADAQSMKSVLEFGLAKLGLKKVINALTEKKTTCPMQVEKALYWLPSMIKPEDVALLDKLK